jgi:hypothetical protein
MFREMRRIRQQLTQEESISILLKCSNGVLACLGDEGYPYAVPLNYVYLEGKIYFHSALSGHKVDSLKKYNKVSFAVVAEDNIVREKYTSHFLSVIVFGKIRIAETKERVRAFTALVEKYASDRPDEEKNYQINTCVRSSVYVIDIEHISGKQKGREK